MRRAGDVAPARPAGALPAACSSSASRWRCSSRCCCRCSCCVLFNSLFAGADAYVDTPAGRWPLQPVLRRVARRVHRRLGHVHEPRQHGPDPAPGGHPQALAGHADAPLGVPRRLPRCGGRHRRGGRGDHDRRRRRLLRHRARRRQAAGPGRHVPGRGGGVLGARPRRHRRSSTRPRRRRPSPTRSSCRWRSCPTSSFPSAPTRRAGST